MQVNLTQMNGRRKYPFLFELNLNSIIHHCLQKRFLAELVCQPITGSIFYENMILVLLLK